MSKVFRYRAHYETDCGFDSNLLGPANEFDASDCDNDLTTDDVWEMLTDNEHCLWCYVWQGREDRSLVQDYLKRINIVA